MNTNIRRLGLFFLVAFAIIVGDITYWQVIDASKLEARADNPRTHYAAARVRRGLIFDRTGAILARRIVSPHGFVSRSYTDPSLSALIGYDNPRYGKYGLERTYDDYLTGKEVGTSWKREIDQLEHKVPIGNNLSLTINDALQQQVASILPDTPSSAIVADPRNGEILAMVGKPTFDANQIVNPRYWNGLLQDSNDPLINRPVNGYYPPGSTFKLLTLSAALDTGKESLSTTYSGVNATGPLVIDSHEFPATINNLPAGVGAVDLTHALAYSDNIVFAQVGVALGQKTFLDYTKRFGLDQPTPFDVPVSISHVKTPGYRFDDVALASTAFGQGSLHVTPLQMLMVAEAVGNGGAIPRPVLVKEVTAPDGSVLKKGDYGTLYRPISAQTADAVKSAMVAVVSEGSGFNAALPDVQVAGKTGTAETGDGKLPHAWFVCFAPADHPRVAVLVMVEHGGEGAFVAAPLAKRILQVALPLVH